VVNGLVSTELEEQISRWSQLGEFVMPDTSFYIRHPDKRSQCSIGLWSDDDTEDRYLATA